MNYKEEIDSYIDGKKDEMLQDLEVLVKIDSQRGPAREGKPFGEGPAAVLGAAQELMERYGFSVKNYDNYVVAGDLNEKEKQLDILAHLDVVPVTEDWTVTQPFEPKIMDGRIYGRGTADDKGPAIAALYALRAIRELGIPMDKNVRLILGSDEECGSGDLAYYYGIEEEAPYTFTPDADFPLINIEKGRMEGRFSADFSGDSSDALPRVKSLKSGDKVNVVPAKAVLVLEGLDERTVRAAADAAEEETGVQFTITPADASLLRVEVRGLAAHASTPAEGRNALTAALRLCAKLPLADTKGTRALRALDALLPYEDTCGRTCGIYREEEQSGATTLCFSILDYTTEGLTGTFDARLPVGCTEENTEQPVRDLMAKDGICLQESPMIKPHMVAGDSPFVKALLASYECYFGVKGEPLFTGGGTYVHELERGVAFGCMTPDVDNHMHGDDEFMVIDRLVTSSKIFADAILRVVQL